MKRRRDRPLRDDEVVLWALVARSVTPLPGRLALATPDAAIAADDPIPAETRGPIPAPPPTFKTKTLPPIAPIERRTRVALKRGVQPIDAVLDLHGLRQDEAHAALQRFLRRGQRDGAKLVLVVTGKGAAATDGTFGERGVLRRVVPFWLRQAELRPLVVGFDEAGSRHGGAGALYVRLRRRAERGT